VATATLQLVAEMTQSCATAAANAVAPWGLIHALQRSWPHWRGHDRQHDAASLLEFVLQALTASTSGGGAALLLRDLVQCSIASCVRCRECEQTRCTSYSTSIVTLNVHTPKEGVAGALLRFSREHAEELSGENKYHCTHCHLEVEASLWSELRGAPKVLILHVKTAATQRTATLRTTALYTKANGGGVFRVAAKLLLLDGSAYVLQGLVLHEGSDFNSGHYVAVVKQPHKDRWLLCDDECISELEPAALHSLVSFREEEEGIGRSVRRRTPVLLFYAKQ
jgi:uncharacterized UBP type Zn finger protein